MGDPRFKKGDKVRCIDSSSYAELEPNKIYTVMYNSNTYVELKELPNLTLGDFRFRLTSEDVPEKNTSWGF